MTRYHNPLHLYYFTDCGHGWLQVEHAKLIEMGFVPTSCSYCESDPNGFAYLEEDCDMPAFMWVCKEQYEIENFHYDGLSQIRRLERFPSGKPSTYDRVAEEMYAR